MCLGKIDFVSSKLNKNNKKIKTKGIIVDEIDEYSIFLDDGTEIINGKNQFVPGATFILNLKGGKNK
jgi:hypothetical protein